MGTQAAPASQGHELPAAKKRLEQAEGEDKQRKPQAERLQSALSRVDHRQRLAQAAKDALKEAQQETLEAECFHQDALLAKDQEELQTAQGLHHAWGPAAREGEGTLLPGQQPQGAAAAAQLSEHQQDFFNRLYNSFPAGSQGPDLLKELAGSLGFPATQEPAQVLQAARLAQEEEMPTAASGPKKVTKQTRIKSQGPYARPGEAASGAGVRSAGAQRAQEEGSPERAADRGTDGGEAEQL